MTSLAFLKLETGLRGAGEDVVGAGYVEQLVGDHEDAELEGCHCDSSWWDEREK